MSFVKILLNMYKLMKNKQWHIYFKVTFCNKKSALHEAFQKATRVNLLSRKLLGLIVEMQVNKYKNY